MDVLKKILAIPFLPVAFIFEYLFFVVGMLYYSCIDGWKDARNKFS
jgi:hypothetical protein